MGNRRSLLVISFFAIILSSVMAGCGGSGGGGAAAVAADIGSIGGVGFKGPVRGGTIGAYIFLDDGTRGPLLADGTTDDDGLFNLALSGYSGPVWLEISSGTYTDEATGGDVDITADKPLVGVFPGYTDGRDLSDVSVTPLTSIAAELAAGWAADGVDPGEAAEQANDSIAAYFGVEDIIRTPPPDLTQPFAAAPGEDARDAALVIAGLSELADDLGVSATELVDALRDDISDGVFDGQGPLGQLNVGGTDLDADTTAADLAENIGDFINGDFNDAGVTLGDATAIIDHSTADHGDIELPAVRRPPVTTASPAGGMYISAQHVTLSAVDADDTAPTIYYTLDGSTPTTTHYDGAGTSPLSGIEIFEAGETTLKFFARDATGNSEPANAEVYDLDPFEPIVVNSLIDDPNPGEVLVTLRWALAAAIDGQTISFDPTLDGATIDLDIIGEEHTTLIGEVMGMRDEPSGPVSYLVGYFERDYGRSALYAHKDVVIDASALPSGITLAWAGEEGDDARVLAVWGDLTMENVSITGGRAVTADISTEDPEAQPWTLGRGGGVAVWGTARLVDCEIYGNYCEGDFDSSRDRGAYGGGVYANIVDIDDCIISGNSVLGGGAAGGGVFSVGGAGVSQSTSTITRCAITGNRINALFTYGAGVYSDGGGIGNRKTLELRNCTIAHNVVGAPPGMPSFLLGMGYWRGGAIYMSNGSLYVHSCTIVENETHGKPRIDSKGRRNLAGGIAATVGNAHAVENMYIGHSIIAGNMVHEIDGESYEHDIYTGSLLYYDSLGYNRIGVIDFSQILAPVPEEGWACLCRRHYPKEGDVDGIALADVVDLDTGVTYSDSILSAGVDEGDPVVLNYQPQGNALDQVPTSPYFVYVTFAEYEVDHEGVDNFLEIMLGRLETHYELEGFAAAFTADFEAFLTTVDIDDETEGVQPYLDPWDNPILTLADTLWYGPAVTWPGELPNYPYIEFWHRLDDALLAEAIPGMGPETLDDAAWDALFSSGALAENTDIIMDIWSPMRYAVLAQSLDQLGAPRPANALGDIGAIEKE